jgi:hypothetical protein
MWLEITRPIFRIEDDINLFRIKKNLLDGELPIYSLDLSPNDLRYFDNLSKYAVKLGYLPDEANGWRQVRLSVNGKVHNVKVRFRGDRPVHWSRDLKSYRIKTAGDDYINNMQRFNLIIFEDRLFTAIAARKILKNFGLMDIRDDIIVLKINGVLQGLYYLQEGLDDNFLEYNQCSNCYVIKTTDNWVEDHGYVTDPYAVSHSGIIGAGRHHITYFDYELSNLDVDEDSSNISKVLYTANELFESVRNKDPNAINYFDIDQLSSFGALRMLIGESHLVAGDNLRVIYKATNSKFYPLALVESFERLKLERGGLDNYLNTFIDLIELFSILDRNDELRYLRNKKVYSFILNNTLLKEYDKIVDKYGTYALSYKTNYYPRRHLKYYFEDARKILEHNMKIVKSNLEYSKFYANVVEKGNKITIEILPDSIAEIKFDGFNIDLKEPYLGEVKVIIINPDNSSVTKSIKTKDKTTSLNLIEVLKDLYFSAGLDENLYPSVRKYRIEIVFTNIDKVNIDNLNIKMRNDITGVEIAEDDAYVKIADGNEYYRNSKYLSVRELQKRYPQFNWNYANGELTLLEGSYVLDSDLIIPKLENFIIEPGVIIRIAENKSILSYSPVTITGTKEKLVRITALDKTKPFGTFAIVGEGADAKVDINWLDISGGNEKWINGMYFSGQFAINYMDVIINNSVIHNSISDDGINIKYADVTIDNSKFYGNKVDQVDLDFVTGIVKNSEFKGIRGGVNGDGLDLSGSEVLVKNNNFLDSSDKGISVGEETKAVIYNNNIINNNIGVAVKDLSKVYFIKNKFKNNNIAVDSYQKKQLFGGSLSYIYNNDFEDNEKDFSKDEQSKIFKIKFSEDQYKDFINKIEEDQIVFPESN